MSPHDLISTLNDEQRQIACTLDRPLFVSAGAGSGKTFTLTRRIAWALSPGSGPGGAPFLDSLDQILVITFTEAAALEIRERVRQTLRAAGADDPRLRAASLTVDRAWISTIHGMCRRILTRHALSLGLDPDFEVASGTVEGALLYAAMDRVMEDARHDRAFREFFAAYAVGRYTPDAGFSGGMGVVEQALQQASRCPSGLFGLRAPDAVATAASLRASCSAFVQAAERLAGCELTPKARAAMEPVLAAARTLAKDAPQMPPPERVVELLEGVRLPRSSKKVAEEHAELKDALARARLDALLAQGSVVCAQALELARRVDVELDALKRRQGVLTNDDLIARALDAVRSHPEIARDYVSRFRLVMVDEFQDTDERQLALISLLAGEGASHLCTVGDAQQSIYRFRGADVGVFRAQGRSVGGEGHVRLATNYRSHADVLSLVERVCGGRPSAEGGGGDEATGTSDGPARSDVSLTGGVLADYMHLDPSPSRRDGFAGIRAPRVSLEVACGPSVAGGASAAQSALLAAQVADRLAQLARAGVEPGRMALLLGVTTHADLYIDAMRARGLECVVTGGSTFTSSTEAAVMCALLHTLANPADTQSGLFRLLASEVFGLDASDLCLLGSRVQETSGLPAKRPIDQGLVDFSFPEGQRPSARLQRARAVLRAAWEDVRALPVADVCLRVVRDAGWLARLEEAGPAGLARAANVLAAVRYIRDLTDELGLGPARAAGEFDRWLAVAKVPPATLSGGVAETVRVMTIHASKGLEFPVVAVAECWRNAKAPSGLVAGPAAALGASWAGPVRGTGATGGACAADGGPWVAMIAPPELSKLTEGLVTEGAPSLKGATPSLTDGFLALRRGLQADDQAEKARLLYVALTRAEEALVVGVAAPTGKAGVSYELAGGTLGALCEPGFGLDELLEPGEREVDFGGTAPARLRVARVIQQRGKDGPASIKVDAAGTLAGVDGEHVGLSPAGLLALGTSAKGVTAGVAGVDGSTDGADDVPASDAPTPFTLFEVEPEPCGRLTTWRAREGVFSYSSAHRVLEAEGAGAAASPASSAGGVPRPQHPDLREHAADVEGAPTAEDADKATNLGSAFHELAQMMVETGREPTEAQVERMVSYWHLSPRAAMRLREALARWVSSDIRAEARTWGQLRAEVPFFVPADTDLSRFGEHVEGAIDLLCTDVAPDGAPTPEALLVDYKTGDRGLTSGQIRERHAMQADFYARVLRAQGFTHITCAFVCVEVDAGELAGSAPTGQPHVVRYDFSS